MDVENHEDIGPNTYIENPMCVVIMPVAEVVGIEVISEVFIEQKRNSEDSEDSENSNINTVTLTFNKKLWFWCNIGVTIIMCLAVLTGFVLLLVWLNNPEVFGPVNN